MHWVRKIYWYLITLWLENFIFTIIELLIEQSLEVFDDIPWDQEHISFKKKNRTTRCGNPSSSRKATLLLI